MPAFGAPETNSVMDLRDPGFCGDSVGGCSGCYGAFCPCRGPLRPGKLVRADLTLGTARAVAARPARQSFAISGSDRFARPDHDGRPSTGCYPFEVRTPILLLTLATLACGQAAARGAGSIPRPPPTPAAAIPSAPVPDVRPAAVPPAVAVEARMVLVAGGDVELGRAMGKVLLRTPTHDPFATVASIFASAEFLVW